MKLLGYNYKNHELLQEALTTPSYRMTTPEARDNQRLEFLGDAVLGLLAADMLYAGEPKDQEGSLTVRRSHLVSTASLCAAAWRHGIAKLLRRNRGAVDEIEPDSKILADAIEALLGAAWLDGGIEAARTVFDALDLTEKAGEGRWNENPKGQLQIRVQAMKPVRHPEYRLLETTGASHNPVFTVQVTVKGVGSAIATAGSRREAEAKAAAQLLRNMV